MRKQLLILPLLIAANCCFAQTNTYPFPSSGNVGIGTTSPTTALDVDRSPTAYTDIPMQKWDPTVTGYNLTLSNYNSIFGIDYRFTQYNGGTSFPVLTFQGGRTGVGTTNPQGQFHVKIDNDFSYIQRSTSTNYAGTYYVTGPETALNFNFLVGLRENSDNFHIYNGEQGVDALTVDHASNFVGIGTTSPQNALHVNGGITSTNGGPISSATPSVNLYYDATNDNGVLFSFQPTVAWKPMTFGAASFSFMSYGTNPGLSQDPYGNVGIRTGNPSSTLQVDDGCSKANIGDASGLVLNYGTSYLGFNASRSGNNWFTNSDGGNNGGGVMYSTIYGDLYFANIPSTVNSSGQTLSDANVTNHINFKIDHDGTTYAKQIIVQTTVFPDYVFKSDYKLKPLSEVKEYIDKNQHLPDMPSAAEIEKDGLNLGEMNKLLTKKVEELTLYLIEKDKQLKEQQAQIEQLQKKNSSEQLQQAEIQTLTERLNVLEKTGTSVKP